MPRVWTPPNTHIPLRSLNTPSPSPSLTPPKRTISHTSIYDHDIDMDKENHHHHDLSIIDDTSLDIDMNAFISSLQQHTDHDEHHHRMDIKTPSPMQPILNINTPNIHHIHEHDDHILQQQQQQQHRLVNNLFDTTTTTTNNISMNITHDISHHTSIDDLLISPSHKHTQQQQQHEHEHDVTSLVSTSTSTAPKYMISTIEHIDEIKTTVTPTPTITASTTPIVTTTYTIPSNTTSATTPTLTSTTTAIPMMKKDPFEFDGGAMETTTKIITPATATPVTITTAPPTTTTSTTTITHPPSPPTPHQHEHSYHLYEHVDIKFNEQLYRGCIIDKIIPTQRKNKNIGEDTSDTIYGVS
jgi:hypothetical protein